jgi:hypothetical protein
MDNSAKKEIERQKQKERSRRWYLANIEKHRAQGKMWADRNKEKIQQYSKKYFEGNIEACRERGRSYYYANKEKYVEWRKNNPDKVRKMMREYVNRRYHSDEWFKLKCNIIDRSHQIACARDETEIKFLGCSPVVARQYIASQFTNGMTWGNHGQWEIDYIVPLASANNEDELKMLAHYTNLQPLWKDENRVKSDSIDHLSSPWPKAS